MATTPQRVRRMTSEFYALSENNINLYGQLVSEKLKAGFEIQDSGMSMGPLGPVWYATMVKKVMVRI